MSEWNDISFANFIKSMRPWDAEIYCNGKRAIVEVAGRCYNHKGGFKRLDHSDPFIRTEECCGLYPHCKRERRTNHE